MKIKINTSLFKDVVRIEEWEIEGMNKEEQEEYIDKAIWEYVRNATTYEWTVIEE